MLELWTRGLYRATPHRVRNAAARNRYSYPFFFDPSFDAKLECIEEDLLAKQSNERLNRNDTITRWDGIDMQDMRGECIVVL
jgi:isopenicillin N synthase-like dioxygenase